MAIFKFIDKKWGENGYKIFALLSPHLAAKVLPLGEPAWGSCVRLGALAGGRACPSLPATDQPLRP